MKKLSKCPVCECAMPERSKTGGYCHSCARVKGYLKSKMGLSTPELIKEIEKHESFISQLHALIRCSTPVEALYLLEWQRKGGLISDFTFRESKEE